MAKWYGEIGYAKLVETKPGVWEEQIIKRNYYGDIVPEIRRLQSSEHLNDDINVSDKISIVADPYAISDFHSMRYAVYMGAKWKISSVEVKRPRLILSLGGLYNGEQA